MEYLRVVKDFLRYYTTYTKTKKFLAKSEEWTKESLDRYKFYQLEKLIEHAYENVPFYRNTLKKNNLKPTDIGSLNGIKKLPYITKNIIIKNRNSLRAINYPTSQFRVVKTGGTTGSPLKIYTDKGFTFSRRLAFLDTMYKEENCKLTDKYVNLTYSNNCWNYALFRRILCLSPIKMTDEIIKTFIKKIVKFKPIFITGYPSAVFNLAKYMTNNHIETFNSLKVIFCSGEALYDWQRNLIENVFQRNLVSYYDHNERAAFGFSCKNSNLYHIYPQYGIIELIDKNGNDVIKENQMGEIVATGFLNYIFPLIRYKTGDIGIHTSRQICECGKSYPLIKNIVGRKNDFIVTKDKKLLSISGFYDIFSSTILNVKESQIYQDQIGEIVLKVVKGNSFSNDDKIMIRTIFENNYDNNIDLKIKYVKKILRTYSNKFRYIIQKIPISDNFTYPDYNFENM